MRGKRSLTDELLQALTSGVAELCGQRLSDSVASERLRSVTCLVDSCYGNTEEGLRMGHSCNISSWEKGRLFKQQLASVVLPALVAISLSLVGHED